MEELTYKTKRFFYYIFQYQKSIQFDCTLNRANDDDIIAMNELAWMFYKGIGTPIDYYSAEYWFKKSGFNNSYFPANFNLSCMVLDDHKLLKIGVDDVGGSYQPPFIIRCIEEAAHIDAYKEVDEKEKKTNYNSNFLLGLIYEMGIGVVPNKKEAKQKFYIGKVNLKKSESEKFLNGLGNYDFLSHLIKGCEDNDIGAMSALGCMYFDGVIVNKDEKKAVSLWLKAAEQNFELIYKKLSIAYANGLGVEQSRSESAYWWGCHLHPGSKSTRQRGTPGENWMGPI